MKLLSTALLAASLVSLAACNSGGAANNGAAADNNVAEALPPIDDTNLTDLNAPAPADLNAPAPADLNATGNETNSAGNAL
jgi:hypothetical protein